MKLHEWLKQEISDQGYKFTFVAKKTGIPYESLLQYLGGHRPIPEAKVNLLCLAFDLDLKKFASTVCDSVHSEASA